MNRLSNEAWGRYVQRVPAAGRAARLDPTYAAQTTFLRQMLDLIDLALEDEGVDHKVRQRVLNMMLYGSPNPYDAEARIDMTRAKAEELSRMVLPPLAKDWLGGV